MSICLKRIILMSVSGLSVYGCVGQVALSQITDPQERDPAYCNPPLEDKGQRCPQLRPPFFEEERQPQPDGFGQTFLRDALSGMSDPLSGLGDVFTKPPATPSLVPSNPALVPGRPAPAILNVDLDDSITFNPPPFPGQLEANGDFTFLVVDPTMTVDPFNLTFNVETTDFQVNNAIPVTSSFVNAVLNDPELQLRLESIGIVIMRQDASNVDEATVTPQGIPQSIPILLEGGGMIMGPIPDR